MKQKFIKLRLPYAKENFSYKSDGNEDLIHSVKFII